MRWPSGATRSRPPSAVSSSRNVTPTTVASKKSDTSRHVAVAVPPVASTSSTIEHAVVGGERVAVHLERVGAVLELVAVRVGVPRQLARLAHRHEAGAERERDRRGEDEAARFDADDLGDRVPIERRASSSVAARNAVGVAEQRRDVAEHDARLREVGDVADEGPERVGVHGPAARTAGWRLEPSPGRVA